MLQANVVVQGVREITEMSCRWSIHLIQKQVCMCWVCLLSSEMKGVSPWTGVKRVSETPAFLYVRAMYRIIGVVLAYHCVVATYSAGNRKR